MGICNSNKALAMQSQGNWESNDRDMGPVPACPFPYPAQPNAKIVGGALDKREKGIEKM